MKTQTTLIGVAIIAVVMAVSNPSKERYVEYTVDRFSETGKLSLCNGVGDAAAQQQCKFGVAVFASQGKPLIRAFLESSTRQQNFVLFSIYTTELPNQKLTAIAAFGNFFSF
jgi:hypothetical protein